ncbi:HAD domain-containing protein [Virgisporangium aliadipatigenens]|uniref:HAD domain-containing protein n=1 Tax=Virgisporangium aliadipatigenens TaxID=741659 RepID=UPI001944D9AF|nr:HAD domain-containing protein [Virgisporangium aliadipatigenens]
MWLLDVDGVINTRRPQWTAELRRGTARSEGVDWPIRWAPALVDRIRRMCATGVVEVRWCSTWCADADALERLFDLPALGRAFGAGALAGVEGTDALKAAAARGVLAEGRRLVWTDDTAVPVAGPLREELTAAGALLIRPHPRRGLRRRDVDRIEAYSRRA